MRTWFWKLDEVHWEGEIIKVISMAANCAEGYTQCPCVLWTVLDPVSWYTQYAICMCT